MNQFIKILFFFFITSLCFAQPSEQQKLEARKAQILKEISENKSRLEAEKKKEKSVLRQISQQKNLIQLRQKLLNTTARQTRLLSDEIYLTQLEMNKLNRELKVLKEDYEKMIVKSYKSRNEQSRIMFVLSAENFLQAYKRIQYMKQYAGFRKMQGEEIKEKQNKLVVAEKRLSESKKEKEVVLAQTEKEKQEAWHKRYRERVYKKQETKAQLFEKVKNSFIYKLSKIAGISSGLITIFLIVNYLFLNTYTVESKVIDYYQTEPQYNAFTSIDITSNKEFSFTINTIGQFQLFDAVSKGQSIYLNTTYLLNDVKSIEYEALDGRRLVYNEYSMSRFFILYLLIFIPFLIILFLEGPNEKYLASIDALTIISSLFIITFCIHGSIIGLFSYF